MTTMTTTTTEYRIAWERHQEITGSDAMISDDAWERYPDIATPDTGDHDYRAVYYHVSANEIMCSLHRSIGLADTTNERRYTEKVEQLVADHECATHGPRTYPKADGWQLALTEPERTRLQRAQQLEDWAASHEVEDGSHQGMRLRAIACAIAHDLARRETPNYWAMQADAISREIVRVQADPRDDWQSDDLVELVDWQPDDLVWLSEPIEVEDVVEVNERDEHYDAGDIWIANEIADAGVWYSRQRDHDDHDDRDRERALELERQRGAETN